MNKSTDHHDDVGYWLESITIPTLTDSLLAKHSGGFVSSSEAYGDIRAQVIDVNHGSFTSTSPTADFPLVNVRQTEQSLFVTCSCTESTDTLCTHQVQVLAAITRRIELRIFFDEPLRIETIRPVAREYGLEQESPLDAFFQVEIDHKTIHIRPRRAELLRLTQVDKEYLIASLVQVRRYQLLPDHCRTSNGFWSLRNPAMLIIFVWSFSKPLRPVTVS